MKRVVMNQLAAATLRGSLVILLVTMAAAQSAETDFQVSEAERNPRPIKLTEKSERAAEALSYFMNGLFEEESEGPDKAVESFRKALAVDPSFSALAIDVAHDYLRRGETAEAITVLKDAAKASPKEPGPDIVLAVIYQRHLKKPEMAVKYANAALAISPKQFTPYEVLWEIYTSQGLTKKADQVLESALTVESKDAYFWLQLAELQGRSFISGTENPQPGALERAQTFVEHAQAVAGNDSDILAKVADFHVLSRHIDRAVVIYKQALEIKPSMVATREKLARCEYELGNFDASIEAWEALVKENPLEVRAYDQLTTLYLKKKDEKRALANAEQALLIEPYIPERHMQVVELLFKQREYDRAATQIGDARKRFPQLGALSYYHGKALSLAKKHDEAIRLFEQTLVEAANSHPEILNSDFYFEYGAASEQAGRYVKAGELFRKSIEMDPSNSARSYNYLGYMWAERNENLEEAEQLIRRALEMEPTNGAYMDSLGWLYYRQNKFQEAVAELLRASETIPEPDAVVYDHLADAYFKLGKTSEAILYWQKALQLDSENKSIIAKLDKNDRKVAQQPQQTTPQIPAR